MIISYHGRSGGPDRHSHITYEVLSDSISGFTFSRLPVREVAISFAELRALREDQCFRTIVHRLANYLGQRVAYDIDISLSGIDAGCMSFKLV